MKVKIFSQQIIQYLCYNFFEGILEVRGIMKKLLVVSLAICLSSSAFALNWQMVGARSMAMGGAGVVTASGTNAQYYNPALLGEPAWDEQTDENGFHFGIQMETPQIGSNTASTLGDGMSYIKDLLKKGYTPYTNMDIGFGLRRGSFAFSIRSLDVMAIRRIGTTNVALADTAAFTEGAIGYGFYLFDGVRLGGNVKVIQGTTMERDFQLNSNIDFSDLMRKSWHHKKLSADWGVDLGATINLSELFHGNFLFNPDIGIVAKNLNTPKFKRPDRPTGVGVSNWNTDEYKLKPQYRAGAAIHPIKNRLTIAADIDLNNNETSIPNYKSRQLSAGAEVVVWDDHTFKVPLRVGMNKNLAEDKAPTYITAGFGTLGHSFDFELGLAVGDRTEKIKKSDIPNAFGLSMSFAWYF